MSASANFNDAMIPAMAEVGRLFEEGEYFVPEMLISARAMKSAMALLKPYLQQGQITYAGRVQLAPSRATCMISAKTWSA